MTHHEASTVPTVFELEVETPSALAEAALLQDRTLPEAYSPEGPLIFNTESPEPPDDAYQKGDGLKWYREVGEEVDDEGSTDHAGGKMRNPRVPRSERRTIIIGAGKEALDRVQQVVRALGGLGVQTA